MSDHRPIEPAVEKTMTEIGNILTAVLPEGYGFMFLTFRLDAVDGRMNYISNARREDMVVAMKELIANMEGRLHKSTAVQ